MSILAGFIVLACISGFMIWYEKYLFSCKLTEAGRNHGRRTGYRITRDNRIIAACLLIISLLQILHHADHLWCPYRYPGPLRDAVFLVYAWLFLTAGLIVLNATARRLWYKRRTSDRVSSSSWHLFLYHTLLVCNILLMLNAR